MSGEEAGRCRRRRRRAGQGREELAEGPGGRPEDGAEGEHFDERVELEGWGVVNAAGFARVDLRFAMLAAVDGWKCCSEGGFIRYSGGGDWLVFLANQVAWFLVYFRTPGCRGINTKAIIGRMAKRSGISKYLMSFTRFFALGVRHPIM